jgi:hypothetical protein
MAAATGAGRMLRGGKMRDAERSLEVTRRRRIEAVEAADKRLIGAGRLRRFLVADRLRHCRE